MPIHLPFKVQLKTGSSPYRQIICAAGKRVVCGQLNPGDPFPSVRALSQALKISPNTAHKAVAELIRRGLFEVRPGVGTTVCAAPRAPARQRSALLKDELERLVVEAKRLSLDFDALIDAVREHWGNLSAGGENLPAEDVTREEK